MKNTLLIFGLAATTLLTSCDYVKNRKAKEKIMADKKTEFVNAVKESIFKKIDPLSFRTKEKYRDAYNRLGELMRDENDYLYDVKDGLGFKELSLEKQDSILLTKELINTTLDYIIKRVYRSLRWLL